MFFGRRMLLYLISLCLLKGVIRRLNYMFGRQGTHNNLKSRVVPEEWKLDIDRLLKEDLLSANRCRIS